MPSNGTLREIKVAAAAVEAAEFGVEEKGGVGFQAFAGLPTRNTALRFPYSYRVWAMTETDEPEGEDSKQTGLWRDSDQNLPTTRVHTLWGALMVGETTDPAGTALLDGALTDWVDWIDDCYRANWTLQFTCSRAKVLRLRPYKDALLGTNHFGILYTVRVVSRPHVLTKRAHIPASP